jgi:purine-binding chemotaxis protein CheW
VSGSAGNDLDSVVVFRLGRQLVAMPVAAVREVVPIAWLSKPIQMPSVVEGILNLGGVAVAVLRLDRLLGIDDSRVNLDSSILVMRGGSSFGLLVDRVEFVRRLSDFHLAPVGDSQSFNGCVTGELTGNGDAIPLVSWDLLLVEEERVRLAEFQDRAQTRLANTVEASS